MNVNKSINCKYNNNIIFCFTHVEFESDFELVIQLVKGGASPLKEVAEILLFVIFLEFETKLLMQLHNLFRMLLLNIPTIS